MNILMLTIGFRPNIGGIETHFEDFIKSAVERKIKITVLTYQPLTISKFAPLIELGKNFVIFRLPVIRGLFYKWVGKPMLEFLYLVPGLFLATPVLLLFKPDLKVIHAHGLIAGFVGVFWGKIFRKKIIISTHSVYNFPKSGVYKKFASWIFKNSDMNLGLSEKSVEEIKNLGVNDKKVNKFTYWVDLNKFSVLDKKRAKNQLGIKDKFVVLFVGRLVEEKGIKPLLQAAKKFMPGITLLIIGTGPMEDLVKKASTKEKKKIVYVGKIENQDLPLYYNGADVTIIPSTHEEGFGRVILESLACGTPVIGANRGAIPEAMDETVGRLIDITSANISQIINFFYNNRANLKKLSENSRKYAIKKYSEKNAEIIINQY